MPTLAPAQLADVRQQYVDGVLSLEQIAAEAGISRHALARYARANGWPARRSRRTGRQLASKGPGTADLGGQPKPTRVREPVVATEQPIDVAGLARRVYHAIEHSLSIMEERMKGDDAGGEPERDMRALGDVLRSVEKLKDLEPGTAIPDNAARRGRADAGYGPALDEAEQLRLRIVERILKLRERGGKPGDPG